MGGFLDLTAESEGIGTRKEEGKTCNLDVKNKIHTF